MPEGRAFPWKFIPRPGAKLSVSVNRHPLDRRRLLDPLMKGKECWTKGITLRSPYDDESPQLRQARMDIARVLQEQLLSLREQSG